LSAIFEIADVSLGEPLRRLGVRAREPDGLRELDRDRLLPEREPLERVLREFELRELEVFVWAISASLLARRHSLPVPHHHYPARCS
jgi:hypothetical protein